MYTLSLKARRQILLLVLLGVTQLPSFGQTTKPIDLCAVLTDFPIVAGKVVTIVGQFVLDREVEALYGIECKTVLIDGSSRPAAAWWRYVGKANGLPANAESIKRFREFIQKNRSVARDPGIHVVVTGRLNTKVESPTSYIDRGGTRHYGGFGHLGAFPFQIDVIDVDIVEDKSQK